MRLFENIKNMNCDIILIIIIIVLIFNLYCKQSNIEKMSNDITDTDITDEIERIVEARYVEDIKAIQKLTKMSSELQSNPQSNPPKLPKPLNSKQSLNISGDLNIGTLNYRETNPTISIGDSDNKMYIKNVKSNNNYSFQIQNNDNEPILKIDKGWSIVTSPDELTFTYNDIEVFKINKRDASETSPVPKTADITTPTDIDIDTLEAKVNDNKTYIDNINTYAFRAGHRVARLKSKNDALFIKNFETDHDHTGGDTGSVDSKYRLAESDTWWFVHGKLTRGNVKIPQLMNESIDDDIVASDALF